ncbi:Protein SRT-40, partial [Aphelenchoides avenae]
MNPLFGSYSGFLERYNCSFYSVDDIPLENRRHVVPGAALLALFVFFEALYIPCIWALSKKSIRKSSCYKLMLYLGVTDAICMGVSGLLTGYFAIVGAVYCSYPMFIYLAGTLGLGLWGAESMTSMILAFNRCLEMANPQMARRLFHGKLTNIWLILPTVYMVVFIVLTPSPVYSSLVVAWLFNPHFGYYDDYGAV